MFGEENAEMAVRRVFFFPVLFVCVHALCLHIKGRWCLCVGASVPFPRGPKKRRMSDESYWCCEKER